jgi:putative ABC transport system substrate-binding protein
VALGALPFHALAQRKARRVALLSATTAPQWAVLRDELEGSAIQFDVRSADGRFDRLDKLASDIVRAKPDVIVAHETAAVAAAAKATQRIPIVMAAAAERPAAANVTGLSINAVEVAGRVIQLIRELKSNARRIAVLANADDPSSRAFLAAMNQASARIRVPIGISRVRAADDYDAVFAQWERLRLQALIVTPSVDKRRAAQLALQYRVPAIAVAGGFVEAGGLMSYSENPRDLGRRAAGYVERILKGAKPAEVPIEPVTKYDLALNLRTARAIEVELPDGLLGRADAVLQ